MFLFSRFKRRRERRRGRRYCHHEQPCWCGLPLDPKFKYEVNMMGGSVDELTEVERQRLREALL